ncbi:hypothetical protein ACA910_013753 [Epithemia clementina (nom. ined.)]
MYLEFEPEPTLLLEEQQQDQQHQQQHVDDDGSSVESTFAVWRESRKPRNVPKHALSPLRRVQFNLAANQMQTVPSRRDADDETKALLWYSGAQLMNMREETFDDARRVWSSDRAVCTLTRRMLQRVQQETNALPWFDNVALGKDKQISPALQHLQQRLQQVYQLARDNELLGLEQHLLTIQAIVNNEQNQSMAAGSTRPPPLHRSPSRSAQAMARELALALHASLKRENGDDDSDSDDDSDDEDDL